jgi:methylated-DNA-[protein]-cysteine S-methyltransferase
MFTTIFETPIGLLEVIGNESVILSTQFVGSKGAKVPKKPDTVLPPIFEDARMQINEYFIGERETFDLPLVMKGTKLQRDVWNAVKDVRFGKTSTFTDIAVRVNKAKGVMVIGQMIHDNPLQLIIPDHRIVTEDQGFSGHADNIWRKDWLLRHEQRTTGESLF